MRFWVYFGSSEPLKLPRNYNHAVQSMIYRMLSPDFREFLHDGGFRVGKRGFKLFTFSQLSGKCLINCAETMFKPPVKLCISSPMEKFVREIANGFLSNSNVTLYGNKLRVISLEFPKRPQIGNKVLCRTLSPITVYSTLFMGDGRKKTYYYSPFEEEFNDLINKNLAKKIQAFTGKEIKGFVNVKPQHGSKQREHICIFKGTVIKGWTGVYMLEGSPEFIEMGYEAGLGSKNSQGFGMIEVLKHA
ncbi:MAG: CRISPR-associated endoribonuclease Cas6 [Nitrososphaerota archaeon]